MAKAKQKVAYAQANGMVRTDEFVKQLEGQGFGQIQVLPGATFKDNKTILVVPTRGMVHHRFMTALQSLMNPMNVPRIMLVASGHEVGHAYNEMIKNILQHPELSKWPYLMTIEDDNLVPPDAHVRLLESLIEFNFDAVSGIYFTKGDYSMPMAYGDPDEFQRTGKMDFRPRDCKDALNRGNIMEVNGIAMGCALWRMDLFREIEPPWFVTVSDVVPNAGPKVMTQDLYFCERAKRAGKRFAVDFRVRVGHLDIHSGVVY